MSRKMFTTEELDKAQNWLNGDCLGKYLRRYKCGSKKQAYYVKESSKYAHYICNIHLEVIKRKSGYKVTELNEKELFYIGITKNVNH